ncbi:MAG: hypothetical protein RCG15_08815 [Candidatus Rickettsia vulgarisii]
MVHKVPDNVTKSLGLVSTNYYLDQMISKNLEMITNVDKAITQAKQIGKDLKNKQAAKAGQQPLNKPMMSQNNQRNNNQKGIF